MKPAEGAGKLRPVTWKSALGLLAVFLVGWMCAASIQFSQQGLVGADSHFHVRYAEIMAQQGPLERFPWTQTSVQRDRFMDKDFLLHVILIPFLGDDLCFGPKVLTSLLAALLFLLVAWFAWRQGFPAFWLAALFLLAAGIQFNFRMSLTRPHLLSVLLSVGFAYFLLRRSGWGLLSLSTLFPLSYTAIHLLPLICLLYGIARMLHGKRFAWRELALVLLGTALGVLLHPNRANLFYHWWLVNVDVMANAWRLAPLMGVEFNPPTGRALVWDSGLIFFGLFGALWLSMLAGVRQSLRTTFLFLAAVGFMVMFLSVSRLVEYWVPFSVLFLFSTAADLRDGGMGLGAWHERYGRMVALALVVFSLVVGFQSLRSLVATQNKVADEKVLERVYEYRAGGRYLARHAGDGDQVFTCGWDTFVFLFYHAPQAHYLVHLDPTFMLAYDQALFKAWQEIGLGKRADALQLIQRRFKARWVFIEKQPCYRDFLRQARNSAELLQVFDGPQSAIFVFNPAAALMGPAAGLTLRLTSPVAGGLQVVGGRS